MARKAHASAMVASAFRGAAPCWSAAAIGRTPVGVPGVSGPTRPGAGRTVVSRGRPGASGRLPGRSGDAGGHQRRVVRPRFNVVAAVGVVPVILVVREGVRQLGEFVVGGGA